MPKTQIDDTLVVRTGVVRGGGPFERGDDEVMKSFWVRVCQLDHANGGQTIAEGSFHGDGPPVFSDDRWDMELEILQGTFDDTDGMATAVLVFESGGDLFTLSWSECVHFHSHEGGGHHPEP
jgi:hypothetical protein